MKPASEKAVQNAFSNVSDDVKSLKKKIGGSNDSMSTQLGIETLVSALFPPSLSISPNKSFILDPKGPFPTGQFYIPVQSDVDSATFAVNPNYVSTDPQVYQYNYSIPDTLLPRTIITLIASKVAGGNEIHLKKIMPWILGAFLADPGSLNQLGIGTPAGNSTSGSPTPAPLLNGLLGNTSTTTLLIVGALIYFSMEKK
jgi:hypothetical protein